MAKQKEIGMGFFAWFKSLFSNTGALIKKMWKLVEPFLTELLSASSKIAFDALKGLAVEAVAYVSTQGLPTDKEKQDAFKNYMINKASDKVNELKDSEINLLRETAVAIYKKTQE